LPRRDAERQRLHHLAVFGPGDVLLIIVAHWRASVRDGAAQIGRGRNVFPEPCRVDRDR
jgi:hypothetical protein